MCSLCLPWESERKWEILVFHSPFFVFGDFFFLQADSSLVLAVTSTFLPPFVLEGVSQSHCQPILLRQGFLYALGMTTLLCPSYTVRIMSSLFILSWQSVYQPVEQFKDMLNTRALYEVVSVISIQVFVMIITWNEHDTHKKTKTAFPSYLL